MNLAININQMVKEIFEEEDKLQVSVAEKILTQIDLRLMESGNDRKRICKLLSMRSFIRKEFKRVRGIAI